MSMTTLQADLAPVPGAAPPHRATLRLVEPPAPPRVHVVHVLVLDPLGTVSDRLRSILQPDGLTVHACDRVADLVSAAPEHDRAALLVHAPESPGATAALCAEIRARTSRPLVCIAEAPTEHEIVAGLDAGADEFITTFHRPHELVARVRAVLRGTTRSTVDAAGELVLPAAPDLPLHAHGITVDRARLEVWIEGRPAHFSPRETQLLGVLLRANGRVVTREDLLHEVWGERAAQSEKTLEKYVTCVRRRLTANGADGERLVAVRGRGYRLIAAT